MRRIQRLSIIALLGLLVAGCGIPVKQDYDSSINLNALQSFNWRSAVQEPTGNKLVDNSLLDSRIRAAVERELTAKGHRKVANGSDYLVAYNYSVQSRMERDPYNSSVGVGVGRGGHGSFGGIGFNFGRERDYEQDTLIIDVIDPATGKLFWRGFMQQRLVWESDPEDSTARINKAVAAILNKFPPQRN
jgi:hypothetical protein